MVAAPEKLFETARPLIETVAQRCFHVGSEAGQGQAAKLLNNYVSSVALAATSEALVVGGRVGLDLEQLVDVLNASSGRTSASTDKAPRSILPGTYDFGFAAEAMRKDVALFVEDAQRVGSASVLARANDELWGRFVAACPGSDFTYIHRYLEDGGT
jgi:3-hydroxyisobutyrate dehydrogenase-like beta-hydroxyacid dehydrogenase